MTIKKLAIVAAALLCAGNASAFGFIPGKECKKIVYEKPIEWNTTYESRQNCQYSGQYQYWRASGQWQAFGESTIKTNWGDTGSCPSQFRINSQNINLTDSNYPAYTSTLVAPLVNSYTETRVKSRVAIAWETSSYWQDEKGQMCHPDDL